MTSTRIKGGVTPQDVNPPGSNQGRGLAALDPSKTPQSSEPPKESEKPANAELDLGHELGLGLAKSTRPVGWAQLFGVEAESRWTRWISQVGVGGFHVLSDNLRDQVEVELKAMTRQQRQALASALEGRQRPSGPAPSVEELLDWLGRGVAPPGRRSAPPLSDPNERERSKHRVRLELLDDADMALRMSFADPPGSHPRAVSPPRRLPWGEIRAEVQLTHGAKIELSSYRGHIVVMTRSVPGARQKPTVYVNQALVDVQAYGSHPRNPASFYSDGFTFPFVTRFKAKEDTRIDVVIDGEHVVLDGTLRQVDADPTPTPSELKRLEALAKEQSNRIEDGDRSLSGEGLREAIRASGKRVLAFSGFATAGFRDLARVETMIRAILSTTDPQTSCVLTGGTDDGIGIASRIAKELGFSTFALRSLKGADRAISATIDQYAFAGRTWAEAAQMFGSLVGEGLLVALGGNAFTVAEGAHALASGARVVGVPELPDGRGNIPGLLTFLMDQAATQAPDRWLNLGGFLSGEEMIATIREQQPPPPERP